MAEAGLTSYRIACLRFDDLKGKVGLEQSLAEACLQWSPQIAVRKGEAVFLEISRSRNLFTERSIAARLLALGSRFGVQAQVTIENSAALALAMARYSGTSAGSDSLPLEALECFLDPFQDLSPDSARSLQQLLVALQQLGISTVGDFCRLPSSGFPARFGKQGAALISQVRAAQLVDLTAWPGFHRVEKITEEFECECENLEALSFVLRGLIDRAMARLRGRNERASIVELELEFENWSTLKELKRAWRVELPVPQGSAAGLLPIIKERLDFSFGKTALPAPARKVKFEVQETVPGRGAQKNFFNQKEEEDETRDALLARLAERLGSARVFMAQKQERYLPEESFVKLSGAKLAKKAELQQQVIFKGLIGTRPTRITLQPEFLKKTNRLLVHSDGRRWDTLRWIGPERLSGEWFAESAFARDYYRVVTLRGEQLWIFIEQGAVYLHGYFD